jgi:hypothetical protein
LDTENSVGNATADLVADRYTWQAEAYRRTEEVTRLYNGDNVVIWDQNSEKHLTRDLRKEMRERREAEAERTWDTNSSQGRVRGEILELRTYLKARKKRLNGKYMDTITKLLTTIHTQEPRIKLGIEGVGRCNFCKRVRKKEEKRTPEHEAWCRVDKEVDQEQIKQIKIKARKLVRPIYCEKTKERDEHRGGVDLLIRALVLEKEGKDSFVRTGNEKVRAPSMKTLKRMAENYLSQYEGGMNDPKVLRNTMAFVEDWIKKVENDLKKAKGQKQEIHLKQEDWKRIVSIFEITGQKGGRNDAVDEYMKGTQTEGNQLWVTEKVEGDGLDIMGAKKDNWSVVVTKNTSQNKQVLKKHGFEQFATMRKENVVVAIKIPKGTEITNENKWARTMDKIQQWKAQNTKGVWVKIKTFKENAGTISMQTVDWEKVRQNEINTSLQWINNKDKINGIATDKDIQAMIKAGISEKAPRK